MILLEGGNLNGLVAFMFGIMLGPPILFAGIGFALYMSDKKTAAKVLFIIAVVYLIAGLGICGGLAGGF